MMAKSENENTLDIAHSPFDALYGLEILHIDNTTAYGRLVTDERHAQPMGLVHGGVFAAIGEAVASYATNWNTAETGAVGVGLSNTTNFMRAARIGQTLHARARVLHAGRSTWVWDVAIGNDDDTSIFAMSRVVVAVRPGGQRKPASTR